MNPTRFGTFGTFPSDTGSLRLILTDESAQPFEFSWRYIFGLPFHVFKTNFTWNVIYHDLESCAFGLLERTLEVGLSTGLMRLIGVEPQRFIPQNMQYRRDDAKYYVPTTEYLLSNIGCFLIARATFYPLRTITVRLAAGHLRLSQILSLFQTKESFLQLYNGFGYHMLWALLFQISLSCGELVQHYFMSQEKPQVNSSAYLYSGLTLGAMGTIHLLGSPFLVQSLFAQVGKPYERPLILPFHRFMATVVFQYFSK